MTCHNCGHCGNIHRADSSVVTWCRRRRQHHTAPIVAVLSSLMPYTVGSAGQNGPRRVSSLAWTSHLGFSFLVSLPNVDGDDGNEIHPARRSLGKRAQWRWSRKHLKNRNVARHWSLKSKLTSFATCLELCNFLRRSGFLSRRFLQVWVSLEPQHCPFRLVGSATLIP